MKAGQSLKQFVVLYSPDRAAVRPTLPLTVFVVCPPVANTSGRCACPVVYRVTRIIAARIRDKLHLSEQRNCTVCACYGMLVAERKGRAA